jgi:phage host-nuclease inhibitor protein Gam
MTPSPFPTASPTITNRAQLAAVVDNIVTLQLEQLDVLRAQADEIAAIREKYRPTLTELDRYLQMETSWVEAWANRNPDDFSADRSIVCDRATIGYRMTEPRVERASRKWTWTEAALKLAESEWGRRYLRIPSPEVNREAILKDLAALSADELREVGLKIVEGERFYLERHGAIDHVTASESNWQEAA